ncbi:MAG TPA: transcription-repair coupling factor, partial [Flavobacteriales bacterium]|nr:transcription-repair coupling factor [Flavobacteriales bacterium]
MSAILREKYIQAEAVKEISAHILEDPFGRFSLKGMNGSMSSCVIAAAYDISKNPFVVVFSDKEEAAYAFNDLQQLISEDQVLFFPSSGQRFIKKQTQQINTLDRTLVLKALTKSAFKSVIVTYSEAIMELTSISSDVKEKSIELVQGEEMIMDLLVEELNERKFERSDFVYEPGQFSWRGGIIDVFSYTSELPFRIEFNG